MKLEFVKMNGIGNDFVFINDMDRKIELTDDQVRWLCDRHFGIGGDGVILVRPSQYDDCAAYMHYINSDGSLAEMCGNGVRCFAKYLVDHKMVNVSAGAFIAETKAGKRPLTFEVDAEGQMTVASIDMGEPILEPNTVPTMLEANSSYGAISFVSNAPIDSPWGEFRFTTVSMGNPHAVCFFDDIESIPDTAFKNPNDKSLATFRLDEIGAFFEDHPMFPAKANIEFAVVSEAGIQMRVYERGDGETLACGTGACATNVAACLTKRAGRNNELDLRGGSLYIEWLDDNHVRMTGPAQTSFTGFVDIDDVAVE